MEFVHPSTILISGPTGSGKTQFVARLLLERMIEPMPNKVIWVYGEWQQLYERLSILRPQIEFISGIPSGFYDSLSATDKNLVILDDQMSKAGSDKDLSRLFTEGSHHRNLTVIYIVQNLFDKGKSHRTVSLNTQYLVIFKSPRDKSQVQAIARQMFPTRSTGFLEAFNDSTKEPYSYMLIDLRPETPDEFRLRSKIFPGEEHVVYGI